LVGSNNADQGAKDVAASILAKLLTSMKGAEEEMKEFLNFLLSAQSVSKIAEKPITALGFSAALMHLLKINEILQFFIASDGLKT
jgi:hypothetical protein